MIIRVRTCLFLCLRVSVIRWTGTSVSIIPTPTLTTEPRTEVLRESWPGTPDPRTRRGPPKARMNDLSPHTNWSMSFQIHSPGKKFLVTCTKIELTSGYINYWRDTFQSFSPSCTLSATVSARTKRNDVLFTKVWSRDFVVVEVIQSPKTLDLKSVLSRRCHGGATRVSRRLRNRTGFGRRPRRPGPLRRLFDGMTRGERYTGVSEGSTWGDTPWVCRVDNWVLRCHLHRPGVVPVRFTVVSRFGWGDTIVLVVAVRLRSFPFARVKRHPVHRFGSSGEST